MAVIDSRFAVGLLAGIEVDKGMLAKAQSQIEQSLNKTGAGAKSGGKEAEKLGGYLGAIKSRVTETWHLGGFGKLNDQVGDIRRNAGELRQSLEGVGMLTGIGGGLFAAASAAGVGTMLKDFATGGAEIGRTAASLGISTDALQRWRGAARLAGLDAGAATDALTRFARTQYAAKYGLPEGTQAVGAARQFGLDGALQGSPENFLRQLAGKIRGQAPMVQRAMAEAFGVEGLLPLLRKGPEEVGRFLDATRRFSDKQIAEAGELQRSFSDAEMAGEKLAGTIASRLTPTFKPMLDGFTGILDELEKSPRVLDAVTAGVGVLSTLLGGAAAAGLLKFSTGLLGLNAALLGTPAGIILAAVLSGMYMTRHSDAAEDARAADPSDPYNQLPYGHVPFTLNWFKRRWHLLTNSSKEGSAPGGATAPGGAADSQKGPLAGRVVGVARAQGASDAAIQGMLAAAIGEGGLSETWKQSNWYSRGAREESYGPWQFNRGGELPGYLASGGKPGDIDAQTKYVLDTMERRYPGFKRLTNPTQAVQLMHDVFKDFGASAANLPAAAAILGALPNSRYSAIGQPGVKVNSRGEPYSASLETMSAQERANNDAAMATIKGALSDGKPWWAGRYAEADVNSFHHVIVDVSGPVGTRTNVASAKGPAALQLRTNIAMQTA